MGKQWKQWQTLFSWAPKSLQMVMAAMKLKRCLLLGRKAMKGVFWLPWSWRGWCSPSLSHTLLLTLVSLSLSLSLCFHDSFSRGCWWQWTGPAPTGRRVVSSPQAQSCSYFWRLTALSDADAFAALSVSIGMNHTWKYFHPFSDYTE